MMAAEFQAVVAEDEVGPDAIGDAQEVFRVLDAIEPKCHAIHIAGIEDGISLLTGRMRTGDIECKDGVIAMQFLEPVRGLII